MKAVSLEKRRQRSTGIAATVFLVPVFFFLIVYFFYPIIETFIISTYKWNGISADRTFVGFANWKKLITDGTFWEAFGHNVVIMLLSLVIQLPIAVILATFLEFIAKKERLSRVFKTIWFIPYLMSSVAVGFLFTYALAANGGIVSTISNFFGGPNIDLLGNPKTALVTIIFVISWQFIPFHMVYVMAGYSGISEDVAEAAVIDGASKWQYFWQIALPLLKPALINAAVLSIVGSLKYFDLIYVMTSGGPGTATELMATYMYKLSFSEFNMGYGSAVAGGMFILISLVALVTMKVLNRGGED